jgi:hypothetical protein
MIQTQAVGTTSGDMMMAPTSGGNGAARMKMAATASVMRKKTPNVLSSRCHSASDGTRRRLSPTR